ncbi:facilitated trehalose transporter Tret1-like isoform X1 [Phymastichus coffea]|uniref:facilitated trehalose transporter Tret1-like isoform X1 n=1 Tax=Phymastichus coffea TaxID=108790 RepID=UPI00273B9FEE|nr:facilitated trehalose transporter Tret1-like isoform X1 [Phymastichus coffea]
MNDNNSASTDNGKYRQFLVAVIVNLVSLSSGITWGWPSPVIPKLRLTKPPVGDAPLSDEKISWIGGLMAIGGLIIIPFCGTILERIGHKKFAHLTGLPIITSWLLILFASNYLYIYSARLLGGMGAAMTLFIVPLYLSEIATEDVRGILGSLLLFSVNIGTLFAYIVGATVSYRLFACLSLLFSLIFVAIFKFMPEAPIYLVRQNRSLQAHKSLMFIRGNNEALVEQELNKLQSQVEISKNSSKKGNISDFLKDRATSKGMIISFGLLGGQQLSGIFAMLSYAETIFQRAGSSVSSEIAPIIIGVIQILGSFVSTLLMERAGRRPLTLISCFGMTISHFLVGLFFYLQQKQYNVSSISWLPIVALSTYVVTYCLGIGPVPFVVTSEVFRPNVSSSATTVCYIFYWIISFVSIQSYSVAQRLLGDAGCFFMLAIFCASCFVFTYCILPETMGRDRQDIINELAGIDSNCENKCNESVNLMTRPV